MFGIFIDSYQQQRIRDADNAAAAARTQTAGLHEDVRALTERLDRMALVSQAMWELLRERAHVTTEQLYAKIAEVDMRDGKRDGKMGERVIACKSCGRPASGRSGMCAYCGEPIRPAEPFSV